MKSNRLGLAMILVGGFASAQGGAHGREHPARRRLWCGRAAMGWSTPSRTRPKSMLGW